MASHKVYIEVDSNAEEALRQVYVDSPEYLDERGRELVDSILYHVAGLTNFRIHMSDGLVLSTL